MQRIYTSKYVRPGRTKKRRMPEGAGAAHDQGDYSVRPKLRRLPEACRPGLWAARFVYLAASCYLAPIGGTVPITAIPISASVAGSGTVLTRSGSVHGIGLETGAGPRGTPPGPLWNVVNTASVWPTPGRVQSHTPFGNTAARRACWLALKNAPL